MTGVIDDHCVYISKTHVDSTFQDSSCQLSRLLCVSPKAVVFGECRSIRTSCIMRSQTLL